MNARSFAYQALCQICINKTYSNLYLRKELHRVDEEEQSFATQLIYGTLQHARYCRYQWIDLAKSSPKDEVAILLDMSMFQLCFVVRLPDYAVVNEMVELAKKVHGKKVGAFVNAILHSALRRGKRELPDDAMEALAIQTSHPTWLIRMWKAQYGVDVCEKIAFSNMETRRMCVRYNCMKTTAEELMKQDCAFTKGEACPSSLYYEEAKNFIASSYYQEGLASIQDEASQMVAFCVDPKPNERILDVCAAPGTKTCHMAELMHDQGQIVCGDIHEHRVELIKQGAKRLGLTCLDARVMDATILPDLEEESFDRVLCDVPCSGYGVLSRKSDIKYHMQSEDMDGIIPIQKAILEKACTMVKPGGILVYSTCTLNKKENEKQVEAFLKKHEEYCLVKQETIFPFQYGSDGFYMAKLQKQENKISA